MVPPLCPLFIGFADHLGHFHVPNECALGTFSIRLFRCQPARGGYFASCHGCRARTCSFIGLLDKRRNPFGDR